MLVGEDEITIRHSIRVSESPGGGSVPPDPSENGIESENYLLCTGRAESSFQKLLVRQDRQSVKLVKILTCTHPLKKQALIVFNHQSPCFFEYQKYTINSNYIAFLKY